MKEHTRRFLHFSHIDATCWHESRIFKESPRQTTYVRTRLSNKFYVHSRRVKIKNQEPSKAFFLLLASPLGFPTYRDACWNQWLFLRRGSWRSSIRVSPCKDQVYTRKVSRYRVFHREESKRKFVNLSIRQVQIFIKDLKQILPLSRFFITILCLALSETNRLTGQQDTLYI